MFDFRSLEVLHRGLAGACGEDAVQAERCRKSQFRSSVRQEVSHTKGTCCVQESMADIPTSPRQTRGSSHPSHLSNFSLSAPVYQRLLERMKH